MTSEHVVVTHAVATRSGAVASLVMVARVLKHTHTIAMHTKNAKFMSTRTNSPRHRQVFETPAL